jgi:hypothetical protein
MNRKNSERLKQILLDYQEKKYPTIPRHLLLAQVYPDTNEKGIKKNVKQWCEAMGFKYTNTDSSAKASVSFETLKHASGIDRQHMSVHYRRSELEKGHHDIEISKNNRLFSIEIKAQNKRTKYKDKQSEVQKEFQSKLVNKYGNDYYIIRGMDDFFELYDEVICKSI